MHENLFEFFVLVLKDNVILVQNVSAEEIILPYLPLEDMVEDINIDIRRYRRIIEMMDLRVLYFKKIN